MAGAMRKMGIYLGLVEDDDARAYGRYDARQSDDRYDDRRYGRYLPEDGYDDGHLEGRDHYDYYEEELAAPEPLPAPEPVVLRRGGTARSLGVAPAAGSTSASAGRLSTASSPGGSAASAAVAQVREPVVAVAPEPAPAPTPKPYRITTLHPRTYNEARQIGESFREGMPVIMNLTEMDDADAKRLVDFAAGLSFGLRGSIERVTAKVFLLSPRDVDVTAEDKAKIREGGFFNQS
ncbi:cell division protein SepF [Blastococcus sp. TF02A-26]|uniref:cell division protein SepF n=1 Tax=Blastococcus sp. TF02A-26 TaxID=2250577 RepID=UPI000DEBDCC5|nr:cell division protein SepF [Blastococcus sp. TF02A-26]RBY88395.1 cell division protein [Blastococcus sp. TF02A-26]